MGACMLNRVLLFATLWIVASQAPMSIGFSRKNTGSILPPPPPGDLPDPGIEHKSPVSPALASRFFTTEPPGKPLSHFTPFIITSSFSPYPLCNFIFSKMTQNFFIAEQYSVYYSFRFFLCIKHSCKLYHSILSFCNFQKTQHVFEFHPY